MTGFLRAQESAAAAEKAADAARRSVELSVVQYREGAVDYQRVLDAQRSLLEEENHLAETRSAIATNWIALYKVLGGGWEIRQGQPIVPLSRCRRGCGNERTGGDWHRRRRPRRWTRPRRPGNCPCCQGPSGERSPGRSDAGKSIKERREPICRTKR